MIATIASAFRTLNSQLLYRQGFVNKVLKIPYLLSVYCFKWWTKKRRPQQLTVIRNYDRDLRIQLDLSKTMGASLYWTGFHEFNEMRFLNRYLRPEMTFIDVGANQGEYSLFAARRVTRGRVLAFEPTTHFFERLNFNIQINGIKNIHPFKMGLSDHRGEVPIYFNADNDLNHEGLASLFTQNEEDQNQEVIRLDVLDEVTVRERIDRIDFIKIDVEGSEWAVLRGAERVLQQHRPALMVELNDETALLAGYTVNQMISWLDVLGYKPFLIDKGGLLPMNNRPAFCNAIFLTG